MTAYRYRAISQGGSVVTGLVDAPNQAAVLQRVRALGQYPVSASPARGNVFAAVSAAFVPNSRTSHRRLSMATQELSTLLQAGLDLDRALVVLERLGDLGPLCRNFASVRARLRDGADFAEALAAEKVFPPFFVSAVRAAEWGGTLHTTLRALSEYLARSVAVRESIAGALVYPIILLVTAGLSIIFILVFVLPEFQPLFAEAGKALPLPTRLIMAIGDLLRRFWWILLVLMAGAVIGVRLLLLQTAQRLKLDALLLRVPVLGPLLTSIDVQRLCRTLGTLLANGVALPAALGLAKDVVSNRVLGAAVAESAVALREGDSLASQLERSGVFPEVTVDLIRVGEESGALPDMLLRQADLDEQRIRHSIDRLLAIMVPALTILLGLMVGTLIASLLTAILSVNDLALPK